MLALIGFIGLAVLVPLVRTAAARGAGLSPPDPALAAALLYPLSGLAAWLVWRRIDVGVERKRGALRRWGWQLLLSGLWPAALSGLQTPITAVLLLLLLGAAAATLLSFRRLHAGAALLLLPCVAWVICTAIASADRFWPRAI